MKLTSAQLRKIIKEEVSKAKRALKKISLSALEGSDERRIAAMIMDLLEQGSVDEFFSLASVVIAYAEQLNSMSSYDEVYESDAREEIKTELELAIGKVPPDAVDKIIGHFFSGADWTHPDGPFGGHDEDDELEEDPLRAKYPEAFNIVDDRTRSGHAEKDWTFHEVDGAEYKQKGTVLIAEPNSSGDNMWWHEKTNTWREHDFSPVWR
jgi:hypothetical protein